MGHNCACKLVAHMLVTHIAVTHISVTHISVTHIAVTHIAVTHISVAHIAVAHMVAAWTTTHTTEEVLSYYITAYADDRSKGQSPASRVPLVCMELETLTYRAVI